MRQKKKAAMTEAAQDAPITAAATTCYERLRSSVLAGDRFSGLGLVVLIREGIVSWLALPQTPSTTPP